MTASKQWQPSENVHTPACWAMPECTVCGLRKKPYGRSAPLEMANSLCDSDCPGYRHKPMAGHFWPGESKEDSECQPLK